jgi:hypothetical protein
VGAVEQALFTVAKFAVQQIKDQAAVADIGHGYQQLAFRCEQFAAGGQHLFGAAQVLQHVGADDGVVALAGKGGPQVARFEVVHHHPAVVGAGVGGFGFAQGNAIDAAAFSFE